MEWTAVLQGVRMMRFRDVFGRCEERELSQLEAAELLGVRSSVTQEASKSAIPSRLSIPGNNNTPPFDDSRRTGRTIPCLQQMTNRGDRG